MPKTTLYPTGPKYVPPDLTNPSQEFRTQAWLVLLSLLLFFGFYLSSVTGSFLFALLSLLLFPIGLIIGIPAFVLFLVLVKGFFRKEMPTRTFRVEITPEEHPDLFDFIDQLCEETQ